MTTPATAAGRQTSLDRLRTEAAAPYRDALAALVAAVIPVVEYATEDGWCYACGQDFGKDEPDCWRPALTDALAAAVRVLEAAERRATVERIRAALREEYGAMPEWSYLDRILDAEAER